MSIIRDEEKRTLDIASAQLASINQKLGLSTAEEQFVEQKIAAMIMTWVEEHKEQERQRKVKEDLEAAAERVRAEREGTLMPEEQRKRIEEQRRLNELQRPTEYPCTICGGTMPHPDMIKHWTNGKMDLCIRKPRLAFKQRLINEDQFEMIKDEGKEDVGTVFVGVGHGDGVIQDNKTHDTAFDPTKNPLVEVPEYQPIKLATR
jgi:hypothetical protein